jgi:hypothetical protein
VVFDRPTLLMDQAMMSTNSYTVAFVDKNLTEATRPAGSS